MGQEKPVLDILPDQNKIRMQHCCPLHPQVVKAVVPLLRERRDGEPMFKHMSFERWLKQQKVQLLYGSHNFVPGDLRKLCEQQGDTLQCERSNKNYIRSHGASELAILYESEAGPVFLVFLCDIKEMSISKVNFAIAQKTKAIFSLICQRLLGGSDYAMTA